MSWSKFNPTKCDQCNIMKMRYSVGRPRHDYKHARNKLHESMCKRDLGVEKVPSLSPEHHIRRFVKEAYYLLVNMNVGLKKMFGKLLTAINRPKLEYASQIWPLHLKKHANPIEKVQ